MATVTTTTTTVTPGLGLTIDKGYIHTKYGKFNLALLALNSVCFICVAAQPWASYIPPQGWFYFVCVTGFWTSLIDILLGLCQLQHRLVRIVPFYLGQLIFHGIWCFFYLTAASSVTHYASHYQDREGWYAGAVSLCFIFFCSTTRPRRINKYPLNIQTEFSVSLINFV